MIFKGSRYQNTGTYQIRDAKGRTVTVFKMRVISSAPAVLTHTFTAGERLDHLAFKFYGNPEKFWRIADGNTEMDPEDLLDPGKQILIPPDQT